MGPDRSWKGNMTPWNKTSRVLMALEGNWPIAKTQPFMAVCHVSADTFGLWSVSNTVEWVCMSNLREPEAPAEKQEPWVDCLPSWQKNCERQHWSSNTRIYFSLHVAFQHTPYSFPSWQTTVSKIRCNSLAELPLCKGIYTCKNSVGE